MEEGGDTIVSDVDLTDADHAKRERFLLCIVEVAFVRIREFSKASKLTPQVWCVPQEAGLPQPELLGLPRVEEEPSHSQEFIQRSHPAA